MKKEKVIDFLTYCDKNHSSIEARSSSISEELEQAIQLLIYRLRELGPMQNPN